MIALEYKPGDEDHEGNFHYNQLEPDCRFEYGINTNGYYPITIIPDSVAYCADFLEFLDELRGGGLGREDITISVYSWAAHHRNLWK